MGWWVGRLLLDAYNIIHHQHFLVSYCVGDPSIISEVLVSMSLLSDAHQRKELESWQGENGLVGEWGLVAGAYNTQHFLVKP